MQCSSFESKYIGFFMNINLKMSNYGLLKILRVELLQFFVGKALCDPPQQGGLRRGLIPIRGSYKVALKGVLEGGLIK